MLVTGSNNLIGGSSPGEGNLITSDDEYYAAIWFQGAGATDNRVEGNYIGTDRTGTYQISGGLGVIVEGANNIIGGIRPPGALCTGPCNLISGNGPSGPKGPGIWLKGASATGNLVQGNFIGTDATGWFSIPNGKAGVLVEGAYNTIGGPRLAEYPAPARVTSSPATAPPAASPPRPSESRSTVRVRHTTLCGAITSAPILPGP